MNDTLKVIKIAYDIYKNEKIDDFLSSIETKLYSEYKKQYKHIEIINNMFNKVEEPSFEKPKTFKDTKNINTMPEETGLYLIGNTFVNPFTKEEFYWIKVGMGGDIKKRTSQYVTYNPMIYFINSYTNIKYNYVDMTIIESVCHFLLNQKAKSRKGQEWYCLSKLDYMSICNGGFSWFGLD